MPSPNCFFDRYVRQQMPYAQSQIVGLKYFNVYGPQEHHKGNMASIFYQLYHQVKKEAFAVCSRAMVNMVMASIVVTLSMSRMLSR